MEADRAEPECYQWLNEPGERGCDLRFAFWAKESALDLGHEKFVQTRALGVWWEGFWTGASVVWRFFVTQDGAEQEVGTNARIDFSVGRAGSGC